MRQLVRVLLQMARSCLVLELPRFGTPVTMHKDAHAGQSCSSRFVRCQAGAAQCAVRACVLQITQFHSQVFDKDSSAWDLSRRLRTRMPRQKVRQKNRKFASLCVQYSQQGTGGFLNGRPRASGGAYVW